MSTYTFPGRVPDLVQDVSLKRARTEVEIDGEKKDVIRVLPAGAPNLDAQGVANAMATAPETTVDVSSVLGKIAQLNSNLSAANSHLTDISDAVYNPESSDNLLEAVGSIKTYTYLANEALDYINNNTGNSSNTLGLRNDASWSGSGAGSLVSIQKRTSQRAHAVAEATGAQSDAAWDGQTTNATIIALLKGIYNKL